MTLSTDFKDSETTLEVWRNIPNLNSSAGEGELKTASVANKLTEVEDAKHKTPNVFEWAPLDFPVPKVQSLPYSGPGTFGQVALHGKFMREFYKRQRMQRVELFDTLGMVIGRIDLKQAMIVEVEDGQLLDSEGYAKIFPIGTNICTYYTNADCRVVIYAVKFKTTIDESGKSIKKV